MNILNKDIEEDNYATNDKEPKNNKKHNITLIYNYN